MLQGEWRSEIQLPRKAAESQSVVCTSRRGAVMRESRCVRVEEQEGCYRENSETKFGSREGQQRVSQLSVPAGVGQ